MSITAAAYVGSGHLNSALGQGASALTAEPAPWLSGAPHRAPHAPQCGIWDLALSSTFILPVMTKDSRPLGLSEVP